MIRHSDTRDESKSAQGIINSEFCLIFTARRYASAVYAVVACPSVGRSVTSWYCIKTTGQTKLVLSMDAFTYPTLCYMEI